MIELTVCLLTRNDEARLEPALRSLAGVAGEVVVGDTGSTDGTVALARGLGARIEAVGWDDDFSAACNATLAAARGRWVLWLNPDEELDAGSRDALAVSLRHPAALAWYVTVCEYAQPDSAAFSETLQPRLFLAGGGLRYVGRLHPHFETSPEQLARPLGLQVGRCGVRLRHKAYLNTLTPDKLRWAARLLERELQDRPGQLHYLIQYAGTLLRLNDARGHAVMNEAAEVVLRAADAPLPPLPAVGELLAYVLTPPGAPGCVLSAQKAKELAGRWFAASPPVLWAVAAAAFAAERFAEAIPIYRRLLEMGRSGQYDRAAAFDPAALGGAAWENLGVCHARLGDLDRAEHAFGVLLTLPGYGERGRKLYAWAQEQRRGR